jgi:hypothetical protein
MNAEQLDWLVGSPVGVRTRVCFEAPSGAHPLTPSHIRQRYLAEVRDAALVVWHAGIGGIGGVRAGSDEIAWLDADIAYFETSFCRPAKGTGYVWLCAHYRDGQKHTILFSERYDISIHEWHLAAAKLLEQTYPGLTRTRDDGYDS